jgi:hypothetical protein
MMPFSPRVSKLQGVSAIAIVSGAVLLSAGCGRSANVGDPDTGETGGTEGGGDGGRSAGVGGTSVAGGTGGGSAGSIGEGGAAGSAGGGAAGAAGTGPTSTGGVKVRLLTQAEYRASVQSLFGDVAAPLDLPDDTSLGGFVAIGASNVTLNAPAVTKYEIASRAVVAEVFGDMTRWQTLVGCQPESNLSDACVETFTRAFGKRAFRRDLSDLEVEQWVQVARNAAMLAGNATQALSTLTSGFLQSPNFLYRLETNALDPGSGRLKYDGPSMAVRLAYFLTGGPPSAELLAAGESGQLDTAEGVRTAADSLLDDPGLLRGLTSFFSEYSEIGLVSVLEKDPALFPTFDDAMRTSMQEGARLFFEKVVLAPGADVRTFFDSDQTFADPVLAPIYGLTPPSSGFVQFTLAPTSGRAGVMGQAAVIAAHSTRAHTSPTRRGIFIRQAFFCQPPDAPPDGAASSFMFDPSLTTRENLDVLRSDPDCGGCHSLFDPLGVALEHFDAIGRYRETENGLPIDASGKLADGTPFDDAVGLGKALRESPAVTECLLRNFYRNVNGRADDLYDQAQVDAMEASLASRGYVLRDMVADFVASDAFRSAPALPISGEGQ